MSSSHRKDASSFFFLRDKHYIASLFNSVFFHNSSYILADQLTELNSRLLLPVEEKQGKTGYLKGVRDLVYLHNQETRLAVLSIENQSAIDRTMALRMRIYEDQEYGTQIEERKKEHRRKRDLSGKEYISGIKEKEQLIPCLSLVIYYGEEAWQEGKKLSELVKVPKELKPYFQDYEIEVIDVCHGERREYGNRELNEYFELIRDINRMEKEEIFKKYRERKIERRIVEAAAEAAGAKSIERIAKEEKGEEFMCKNWDRIEAEIRQEGAQIGKAEGHKEGLQEGMENTRKEMAVKMMRKGIDIELIKELTGLNHTELSQFYDS